MSGDTVVNVIVAESKEIAENLVGFVIEYDENNPAAIGWEYDEVTGKFSNPTLVETTE
jgi:hypothetical protein